MNKQTAPVRQAKSAVLTAIDSTHHAVWTAWDESLNLVHVRQTSKDLDAMKRDATALVIKLERALAMAKTTEGIINHDIEENAAADAHNRIAANLLDMDYAAAAVAIKQITKNLRKE